MTRDRLIEIVTLELMRKTPADGTATFELAATWAVDAVAGAMALVPAHEAPPQAAMATQSEAAKAMGFSGDACIKCGNFTMKRAGICLTCVTCGETTGCS